MSVRLKTLCVLVLCAAGLAATAPAAGAVTWSVTATKAMQLPHATRGGALPAATPLRVVLGLRERNPAALKAFAKAVNSPGNAQYGHYLTPHQFTLRYAPTWSQVSAVERYLRAQGFTGVGATSNWLYVTAAGTAGRAQRAFDTSLSRFTLGGHSVYANTTAARVPAALKGTVLSVLGLNNVSGFTTPPKTRTLALAGCGVADYGTCAYTPQGFRAAYDTGSRTGAATAIAIMAEGNLSGVIKDLRTAERKFGEPQVPVSIVRVGRPSSDTSGSDEWDLDSQYSTGTARNVKRLYMYDATSLSDADIAREFNAWARQDVAKAASASFGECEIVPYLDGLMASNDQVMAEAAAQGQTMHASSGDTGGQSCAVAPTNGVPESGPPEVNYPCSSTYIVCVGGTTLFTNSDGSYNSELGWNAGGGGISTFERSPAWQSCAAPSSAAGLRGVPDLAMDADPGTGAEVYVNGTPETVGGTSLSSPLALGSWAVLESSAGNRFGFAAPALYRLYPAASYCAAGVVSAPPGQLGTSAADPTYPFHDVYLGSNVAYPNTFGWDYVTGLGTYDVAKVLAALRK